MSELLDLKTYQNTRELCRWVIQMSKADSAFVYFTLEASEGICFYSTLDSPADGSGERKIEITTTVEFTTQVSDVLKALGELFPLTILEQYTFAEA